MFDFPPERVSWISPGGGGPFITQEELSVLRPDMAAVAQQSTRGALLGQEAEWLAGLMKPDPAVIARRAGDLATQVRRQPWRVFRNRKMLGEIVMLMHILAMHTLELADD
jgi:hypothetical protein